MLGSNQPACHGTKWWVNYLEHRLLPNLVWERHDAEKHWNPKKSLDMHRYTKEKVFALCAYKLDERLVVVGPDVNLGIHHLPERLAEFYKLLLTALPWQVSHMQYLRRRLRVPKLWLPSRRSHLTTRNNTTTTRDTTNKRQQTPAKYRRPPRNTLERNPKPKKKPPKWSKEDPCFKAATTAKELSPETVKEQQQWHQNYFRNDVTAMQMPRAFSLFPLLFLSLPLSLSSHSARVLYPSRSLVHTTGCRRLRNRWNWTFCIHSAGVLRSLVHATGCRQLTNWWNWTFCIHAAEILHPFSVGGAYHRLQAVGKPMELDVYAPRSAANSLRFSLVAGAHHPPAAGGWTTDETWTFALAHVVLTWHKPFNLI